MPTKWLMRKLLVKGVPGLCIPHVLTLCQIHIAPAKWGGRYAFWRPFGVRGTLPDLSWWGWGVDFYILYLFLYLHYIFNGTYLPFLYSLFLLVLPVSVIFFFLRTFHSTYSLLIASPSMFGLHFLTANFTRYRLFDWKTFTCLLQHDEYVILISSGLHSF